MRNLYVLFTMQYISKMPKGPDTIRKEVHLLPDVIRILQEQADKEKRSLKNYMESLLETKADELKKGKQYRSSWNNRTGYPMVTLFKEGKPKHYLIHRLVALAFIPNPLNKPCINHIDGNKKNHSLSNLEWVTYSENGLHAYRTGLNNSDSQKGVTNGQGKYPVEDVREAKRLLKANVKRSEIMQLTGLTKASLKNIRHGRVYNWLIV